MGLRFPKDLDAWRAAHRRRNWRPWRDATPRGVIVTAGPAPDILVAVDNASTTSQSALLDTVADIPAERLAVLAGMDPIPYLPTADWTKRPWALPEPLPKVATVLVTHAVALGRYAAEHATRSGARLLVIQHGILTPEAPPLPTGAEFMAWSGPDVDFMVGARTDITRTHVVGAQLLAKAARTDHPPIDQLPVYLGQLHGAELPRGDLARAAFDFCIDHSARYRPHPSEIDVRSRWQRRRWVRKGLDIEDSGRPLLSLGAPVVAVYSTGVLEAAAAGIPAWVQFPDPPTWLASLWERYAMAQWGGPPTRASSLLGSGDPARHASFIVQGVTP